MSMLFLLSIFRFLSALFSYVTSYLLRNFFAADRARFKTPPRSKRIEACWVLKASGGHAVAWPKPALCQHPQAPTQPARLRLGCCIGSRSAGARAGNSWLCMQTVRISLLARGELRLSQLAGIYKYLWHSLHYCFSWAVNIRLLIAGKKLTPL